MSNSMSDSFELSCTHRPVIAAERATDCRGLSLWEAPSVSPIELEGDLQNAGEAGISTD